MDAYEALAKHDVLVPAGTFYAYETFRALGLPVDSGLRIGLAAYTDDSDVDRLLEGLDDFLGPELEDRSRHPRASFDLAASVGPRPGAGLEADPPVEPRRRRVVVVAARADQARSVAPRSRAAVRAETEAAVARPRRACSSTHPTGSTRATPVASSSQTQHDATHSPSGATTTWSVSGR